MSVRLRTRTWTVGAALLLTATVGGGLAHAQARRPAPRPAAPPAQTGVRIRAFGDAGFRMFTAAETFTAVLGSSGGPIFGGGVEALVGRHLSVGVDVTRFHKTGERVFVSNGQVFPLGLETDVTVVPIAISAAYRFPRPRRSMTPFVGGGFNIHRYTETSKFAGSGEDASANFTGYHALGGAEWRVARLVSIAGIGRWLTVPNAIGQEPTSAATAFGESNLGGVDARIRVVIGR